MRLDFSKYKIMNLKPGEIIFCRKPIVISTILGSCVSITMFNSRTKTAGISHCLLPVCSEPRNRCECKEPYKYVDCTIEKMIEKFESLGIRKEEIEVKIFGGGDVLDIKNKSNKSVTVGRQNILSAVKNCKEKKLNVVANDLGGSYGRKIFFIAGSGEIYLARLTNYEEN